MQKWLSERDCNAHLKGSPEARQDWGGHGSMECRRSCSIALKCIRARRGKIFSFFYDGDETGFVASRYIKYPVAALLLSL